jgi:hypothetical protein
MGRHRLRGIGLSNASGATLFKTLFGIQNLLLAQQEDRYLKSSERYYKMEKNAGEIMKSPTGTQSVEASPTHAKSSEKPEFLNDEGILEALALWEAGLKAKTPHAADAEFGRIHERLLEIGRAIGKRVAASNSQRCAACRRVFTEGVRPKTTIPHYDYTSGGYVNWYACSATCAAKLIDRQREDEARRHGLPPDLLKPVRT